MSAPPATISQGSTAAASPTVAAHLVIALDLPLPGAASSADAVRLAIRSRGPLHNGASVSAVVADDTLAATGFADPQQGATNAAAFVADPTVVGLIGPYNSTVARSEIPVTNAAGLLQCGFATTASDVTKPPSALELRAAFPDRINFVRIAAPDDLQGPAAARFAVKTLRRGRAFVVDDGHDFGRAVADGFADQFVRFGGSLVGRGSLETGAATSLVAKIAAAKPDVVYFGGDSVTGAGDVRAAMAVARLAAIPFLGPDGMTDQLFLDTAGSAAGGSYGTVNVIGDYPQRDAFLASYRAAFGADPGHYDAAAYACAELILDALDRIEITDPSSIREQVRAIVTSPKTSLPTILGSITFDANGDNTRPVISIYRVDPAAGGGTGGWAYADSVTLTP